MKRKIEGTGNQLCVHDKFRAGEMHASKRLYERKKSMERNGYTIRWLKMVDNHDSVFAFITDKIIYRAAGAWYGRANNLSRYNGISLNHFPFRGSRWKAGFRQLTLPLLYFQKLAIQRSLNS